MHSVIKLFNLFVASVSLCLFVCPISGWEVGKLPVASPHVVSISTPWQSHSGTLIINYTDFYPCDEAKSLTHELPSVWVFIFHMYDTVSSSSASSGGVLQPKVFRLGLICGATIIKILDSGVRDAVIVLVVWCLCAAALAGFVCWVRSPTRRPSRGLLMRGSSGCSHRRYRPSLWRRLLCLRPYIVSGMFLNVIWPFMVSFGTLLFNQAKSAGSWTARLLTTITEPLAKPAADLSHRLGNLLISSVQTPEEIAKGFVSLSFAVILCCFFIWVFVALFLMRTSDVKRSTVLDETSGFLVILHPRITTSGTLDGHGETSWEQLVIPRVWFTHSKDPYKIRVSLLLDVDQHTKEYSTETPKTKKQDEVLQQSVQNVSGTTTALQESLPTGRSLPKQQSPSTIEPESSSTLQLSNSSFVNTSQDLVVQQQSCQKEESFEIAVSEQKSAQSVESGTSTPVQSSCDPEACDRTLFSQTSLPQVPDAAVSEQKSSQLFESGSSTTTSQPFLDPENCDRPSQDKLKKITPELKSPQLNGSKNEKQPQAPLDLEICEGFMVPKNDVSVSTELESAQLNGSGSLTPLQPSSDPETRKDDVPQQQTSQHYKSETSTPEEKTAQAKRSGSLATLQPPLDHQPSGRSLRLQQPQQTVGNESFAALQEPSQRKKHERNVLKEQPSNVDGSQGSCFPAHSAPPKELKKTGVHLPLQNKLQLNTSKRPGLVHQVQKPTGTDGGFSASRPSLHLNANEKPVLIQEKPKPIGITFRESVPYNALQNKGYGRFYQQALQSRRQVISSFKRSNPVGQRVSCTDPVHKAQNVTTNQSSQPTGSGKPVLIQQPPSTLNGITKRSVALNALQNKGDMRQQNDPLQHTPLQSKGNERPALLQTPQTHEAGGLSPLTQSKVPGRYVPLHQSLRYNGPMQVLSSVRPIASEGSTALTLPSSHPIGSNERSMPITESSKPNGSGKSKPPQQMLEPSCFKLSPLLQTPGPLVPMKPRLLFKRSDWVKSVQPSPQTTGIRMPTPVRSSEQAVGAGMIDSLTKPSVLGGCIPPQPPSRYNGPTKVHKSAKPMTSEGSTRPRQSSLYNGPSQGQLSAKPMKSEGSKPHQQSLLYNGPSQGQQSAKPMTSEGSKPHQQSSLYNGPSQGQQSAKPMTCEGSKPPQQSSLYNGPSQGQQSAKPMTSEGSKPHQQSSLYNEPSQGQQSVQKVSSEASMPPLQSARYNGPTEVQQSAKPKSSEASLTYKGPSQVQQSVKTIRPEVSMPPRQTTRYNGPSRAQQSAKPMKSEGSKPPQQSLLYNGPSQGQQSVQKVSSEASMPPLQSVRYNGPTEVQQSAKPKTSEASLTSKGPSQVQQSVKAIKPEVSMPPRQNTRYNGPSRAQQSAKPMKSEGSKPPQQSSLYNGPSQCQQSVKPITTEGSKPPQQSSLYNGPSQGQQSAKPMKSEGSKPHQQSSLYNGPSQGQQSAKPITSKGSKLPQLAPRYNGPSKGRQSAQTITSEGSKVPQQSPLYNGPTQVKQCAQLIMSEGAMPPTQAPKYNGPTQSAQTLLVDGFMPSQQSPRYNGPTQVQKFGAPIPSAGYMPQRQPSQPSGPNGRSWSVSSPVNGPGKSKPEQQIIKSNCSKSTPLLQTPAPLVPMKPRLLFKRSEWATSIQQQPPRTLGNRMPLPMQNSTIPAQSGKHVTSQHTPQPDPYRKSTPLLQTPKQNEAGTPALVEKSPSKQLQLVGPGGHTKELTVTSQEGSPVSQLADVEVTKHVVSQDKPVNVGEKRSVRFAEGESLLVTAFIVKNSSRLNVQDSLITPKCHQTKPKSSRTLKGILVEDNIRRGRSLLRPWVEIPSFPPSQVEAVRATKAVADAKKAREDGLAVERENAAETVVPVYNELLQIPAGLAICHFETE